MYLQKLRHPLTWRAIAAMTTLFLTVVAAAAQNERSIFVVTSTNSASGNAVAVFKLNTAGTPDSSLNAALKTERTCVWHNNLKAN